MRKQKKENNVLSLFCSISQYCYFSITNQNNNKQILKKTKITTYNWTISNVLTHKHAPFSQLLFCSETKPINVTSLFSLPVLYVNIPPYQLLLTAKETKTTVNDPYKRHVKTGNAFMPTLTSHLRINICPQKFPEN